MARNTISAPTITHSYTSTQLERAKARGMAGRFGPTLVVNTPTDLRVQENGKGRTMKWGELCSFVGGTPVLGATVTPVAPKVVTPVAVALPTATIKVRDRIRATTERKWAKEQGRKVAEWAVPFLAILDGERVARAQVRAAKDAAKAAAKAATPVPVTVVAQAPVVQALTLDAAMALLKAHGFVVSIESPAPVVEPTPEQAPVIEAPAEAVAGA